MALSKREQLNNMLKILDLPEELSINKTLDAIKKVRANIFHLVDALKAFPNHKPIRTFASVNELAAYSKRTGLIFPKERAKKSLQLKPFLRHLFPRATA